MKSIKQRGNIVVPVAIVIAAIIIALAIAFTNKGGVKAPTVPANNNSGNANTEIKVEPVTDNDHIRGNINAKVKIVEYSDIECPFCKRFHSTLQQIVSEYSGDQIAWVYRQFPLVQRHPKAFDEANATECVAELGGNDKFWQYLDALYEKTPSNNKVDLSTLAPIAEGLGINKDAFNACQASMKYKDLINAQIAQAAAAGGNGTPHTILIGPNGKLDVIVGAQPYEVVKAKIDALLAQ